MAADRPAGPAGRRVWRDLPPLPPIAPPPRYSQTLLKHANRCMRSAYLYLAHGSAPAHNLDRGTAFHLWAERVAFVLLQNEEEVLEADVGKDLMEAVLEEHPRLGVTAEDAKHLREMAYHMAGDDRGRAGQRRPDGGAYPVGFGWQPLSIVAVERMFALELAGVRIVGKVDLAWLTPDRVLRVRDYKTAASMPDRETYEGSFQTKLYAALILFGRPVGEVACEACEGRGKLFAEDMADDSDDPDCSACEGAGVVEQLEPSIGDGLQWVETGEVFPRFVRDDGTVQDRTVTFSRDELAEFLVDVERVVRRLSQAFEDREWVAVRGTHCSECPAKVECPLPAALRSHAEEVNTVEQAEEAMTWAEAQGALVSATREEVKRFARAHDVSVPCGLDEEYRFVVREQWRTADWDTLEQAVERARMYGEPFALGDHRRRSVVNSFKKVRRERAT